MYYLVKEHMKTKTTFSALMLTLILVALVAPDLANASTGGGIPELESPLQKLQLAFTGPIAISVSLIGLVTVGGTLVFGGELNEFSRRGLFVVLVIALIVGATSIMGSLFGISGAVI
jgi:type IV secretion system protein TrbC